MSSAVRAHCCGQQIVRSLLRRPPHFVAQGPQSPHSPTSQTLNTNRTALNVICVQCARSRQQLKATFTYLKLTLMLSCLKRVFCKKKKFAQFVLPLAAVLTFRLIIMKLYLRKQYFYIVTATVSLTCSSNFVKITYLWLFKTYALPVNFD